MELLEPAVKGVVVGDPARGTPRWARWCRSRTATRSPSYVPDDAPVAFRGSAPTGPGYWFPPTVLTPAAHRPHGHRGDLRPGGHGAAVRRRGRRHRAGQRHRVRPVRIDLDRQPVAGAAGVARGGSRQPVASTRIRRCATARRSAGSSSPGWAANSDPMPRCTSPKPRTSSSRSGGELDGSDPATDRTRSPSSPAAPAASDWRPPSGCRPKAPSIVIGDVDPADRQDRRRRPERDLRAGRRLGSGRGGSRCSTPPSRCTAAVDIAFNNAGHQPAGGRPDREHRDRRVAPGAGHQPQVGVLLLQGRAAAHGARSRRARSSTPRRSSR